MGVNFGKLKIITGLDDDVFKVEKLQRFDSVEQIPGWKEIGHKRPNELIKYLETILDKPRYAAQVLDIGQVGQVQTYHNDANQKRITAAYGFKMKQMLGMGKDGQTYEATRYLDYKVDQKYVVKMLSEYAKEYHAHTQQLFEILDMLGNPWHPMIQKNITVKGDFMYYPMDLPYTDVIPNRGNMLKQYAKLANFNKWLIKNTGFLFWDMGFTNGRNFMMDSKENLVWIDYGGAGLLKTPTFRSICKELKIKDFKGTGLGDVKKEMLVNADSKFIMAEFLLNIDYWFTKYETDRGNEQRNDADLYSSFIQLRKSVCYNIVDNLLEHALNTDVAQGLYQATKEKNWVQDNTWKDVWRFLDDFEIE